MRAKKFDAVEMKRSLQKKAEQKLSAFSEKEQLELLAKKYGHLKPAIPILGIKKRTSDTAILAISGAGCEKLTG